MKKVRLNIVRAMVAKATVMIRRKKSVQTIVNGMNNTYNLFNFFYEEEIKNGKTT